MDADDFSESEATGGGSAGERVGRMILERARALPKDLEGLYGRLLTRVEKVAGKAESRAFAGLIALSRHGWREEDLEKLLPVAAGIFDPEGLPHPWDPLRFAILRRLFRAHLVKRGALEQWDFAHCTLRQALFTRLEKEWRQGGEHEFVRPLYVCGVDYLESLPPGTDVRADELMWQMIGTRDAERLARYYIKPSSDSRMLALFLGEDEGTPSRHLRRFVLSLLSVGDAELRAAVARKINFYLNDALELEGRLPLRKGLLDGTLGTFQQLVAADPGNVEWQRDLSVSQDRVGNVLLALGDLAGALVSYRDSLAVRQRLVAADPGNTEWQQYLGVSHNKVGDVLIAQGDLVGALISYREDQAVMQRLAVVDPGNPGWQRDLSVSHINVGDVLRAQGDLARALVSYRESLAVCQRLAAADPINIGLQRNLGVIHDRIGDVLRAQGDLAGAQVSYRESLAVRQRLVAADPGNAGWQWDLCGAYDRVGDVLLAQGDLTGAQVSCKESLAVRQRLVEADPTNSEWQRGLSISQQKVGDVLLAQGNMTGAQVSYRESQAMSQRLAATDPSNAGWQRDLWVSCCRMAMTAEQNGTGDASKWWRKAYDTLNGMKQRGLFISPQDEQFFEQLLQKINHGGQGGHGDVHDIMRNSLED